MHSPIGTNLKPFVLKYRIYYYPGMVRPTVQVMTAIGKIVCYSSTGSKATWGKHQDPSGGRGSKRKVWAGAFIADSAGRKK